MQEVCHADAQILTGAVRRLRGQLIPLPGSLRDHVRGGSSRQRRFPARRELVSDIMFNACPGGKCLEMTAEATTAKGGGADLGRG